MFPVFFHWTGLVQNSISAAERELAAERKLAAKRERMPAFRRIFGREHEEIYPAGILWKMWPGEIKKMRDFCGRGHENRV